MKMKFLTGSLIILFSFPLISNNYQKWNDVDKIKMNSENIKNIKQSISEVRKKVDKKFTTINKLLELNAYSAAMEIFYEVVTMVSDYDKVENFSSDLQWMKAQISEMKARFAIDQANGDNNPILQRYFQKKQDLDALFVDLKTAKEGLENLNDKKESKFSSKDFLKKIVRKYDLVMREFRELDVQSVINHHLFSWEVFSKYKDIESFIVGDNKTVFHQYVKDFLDYLNSKFENLIKELDEFDHKDVDSEKRFEKLKSLHDKLMEYRDDIKYLISEDFKQEFPDTFMNLETFSMKAETFVKDLDEKMICSFTNHFNEWNNIFKQQKEKITENDVWSKIEELNATFVKSHQHYKTFKKDNNDLELNYNNSDFALKTVINTINTIEYKGEDKIVIEDKDNPDYVTYYMSEHSYAAFKTKENLKRRLAVYIVTPVLTGYPVHKFVYKSLANYVMENGRVVSWARFKYFPNWAPKWLGKLAGGVSSAVVSGLVTVAMDAVFGNLVDDIINKNWVSNGAGVSFKVNQKWMWVGAYLADSFHKTAKAQEMKYLSKIEE